MAPNPVFAATPKVWCGKLQTGQSDLTGGTTTGIVTVATGGTNGSKIEEVVAQSDGNPADSVLMFALHDGSTYFPFDTWDIGDPAAGSTTVAPYRTNKLYDNLLLPTSSWTFRAWITVTPTSGSVIIAALGADF